MKPAGFENGQGIITAQYLKDPTDRAVGTTTRTCSSGRPSWHKHYPTGNLADGSNVYGYAVATLLAIVAQAVRRRPDAREHHEAGGQHQGRRAAACCSRHQGQHQPDRLLPAAVACSMHRFKGETWELFGEVLSNEARRASSIGGNASASAAAPVGGRSREWKEQMAQATATFERIKSRPAYELVAEAIERKILAGRLQARRSDRHRVRARQAVRRQPLDRARGHPPARAVGPRRPRAEPPPVGGCAALPSPRHPHDARADPAAGDVPRAVAHVARAGARRRRPGHGQPTDEDLAALAANVEETRRLAATIRPPSPSSTPSSTS